MDSSCPTAEFQGALLSPASDTELCGLTAVPSHLSSDGHQLPGRSGSRGDAAAKRHTSMANACAYSPTFMCNPSGYTKTSANTGSAEKTWALPPVPAPRCRRASHCLPIASPRLCGLHGRQPPSQPASQVQCVSKELTGPELQHGGP